MSTAKKSMRIRTLGAAGGIALIGVTGAGLAGTANAATTSSASTTLAKIKYCESGGNYQAVNSSSGASGAYQFLNSTWRGLSASAGYSTAASAPASVQDAAALELYNQAGTTPWAASSSCWSKLASVPGSSTSTTSSSTSTTTASSSATSTASASRTTHAVPAKKTAPHKRAPQAAKMQKLDAHKHHPGKHRAKPGAPTPPQKPAHALPPVA